MIESFVSQLPALLADHFPEAMLALAIIVAIPVDLILGRRWNSATAWFGILVFAVVAVLSVVQTNRVSEALLTSSPFVPTLLTSFVRLLACFGGAIALLAAIGSPTISGRREAGEYAILVLSLALGAILFASSTHLLAFYLSLEFLSLVSYALAGLRARSLSASESGLKYVLYGGLASALMLFGMSHLFGMTGHLDLVSIGAMLANGAANPVAWASLALMGVGFAYKLALVPFHFWSPDVYQGSPAVSAALLSTVPKAAGFAGLVHALLYLFPADGGLLSARQLGLVLTVFAVLTMTVGNLTALAQKNARRILAFSSVANAGYILLALGLWITEGALIAMGFYLFVYLFANMGAFLALDRLEGTAGSSDLPALAGSWQRHPWTVGALCLFVFSLAGIPPLSGFLAKWLLLREAVGMSMNDPTRQFLLWASVALLANSVISVFAYLKVIRAAAVESTVARSIEIAPKTPARFAWLGGTTAHAALAVCFIATIALGLALPVFEKLRSMLVGG